MKFTKKSVQYLYRPVLHDDIPPIPLVSDINSKPFIWWKEQIKRCKIGWIAPDGVWVNPIHYFYMNFVTMSMFGHREDSIAELTNPFFRDNDKEILDFFWNNMSHIRKDGTLVNSNNTLFAKPRAIAYTYMVNYAVNLWTFIFRPDKPIVFAYEDEDLKNKENKEFVECYKRLHPIFKRRHGENVVIVNNNQDLFSVALESEMAKAKVVAKKERSKDQEVKYFNRAIFILGTRDKGKLKGERVNLITIAEVGKWTRLKDFIDASEPVVSIGTSKFGMINAGGTSDDIAPNNTDFEDLFNNPEALNFRVHKTYANMVLKGFVDYETGISDKVSAKEFIKSELKKREKERKSYINYKTAFPLEPEDFFMPTVEYCFDSHAIEEQEEYVNLNNLEEDWRQGKLIQEVDVNGEITGNVIFKEDKPSQPENLRGPWFVNILKHPQNSHVGEFVASIDDVFKEYGTQEEANSATSKNCMIIYSKENPYSKLSDMPVAMYFGRPRDNNVAYENFALGMGFYDMQQGSVAYEYHTPAFPKYLESIGMLDRLYHVNGQPGFKMSDTIKAQSVDLGNTYIKEQRLANWTNLRMLKSLKKWTLHKKVNDDIGSALTLLFYFLDLLRYNVVKPIFNGVENKRLQPFQLNKSNMVTGVELQKQNIKLGPRSRYQA